MVKHRHLVAILLAVGTAVCGLTLTDREISVVSAAPTLVDTTSMESVRNAYLNSYQPALSVNNGWNGNASSCLAGTAASAARDATVTIINYFRALAGLKAVTENSAATAQAQQAALMMHANNSLSHTPPGNWKCWTQTGYESAGWSNLALGFTRSAETIAAYMSDDGIPDVGHRAWLLYPPQSQVGIGIAGQGYVVQFGNISGMQTNTGSAGGTAWPSPNYFPFENIPASNYWSYSDPSVNFAGASVKVTKNGNLISISNVSSYGVPSLYMPDPLVSWKMPTIARPPTGGYDTYRVTISGPVNKSYEVKVFGAVVSLSSIGSVTTNGTVAVGKTLKVTAKTVNPSNSTLSYQWYRGSTAIAGATSASYTLTWDDMCKQVSAKVTASASGYTSSAKQSASTTLRFTDVGSSHLFYSSICWVANNRITTGSNAAGTKYAPANAVNRGSMAAFLYRLAGSPKWTPPAKSPFVDVKTNHKFYSAITWLYAQRITVGVSIKGKLYYQPSNPVNRGSMSAFLYRMAGSPTWKPPSKSPFTDITKSHQFYSSVTWLAATKITVGSTVNGKLVYKPSNAVNRGSMSAFLNRLSNSKLHCGRFPNGVGC